MANNTKKEVIAIINKTALSAKLQGLIKALGESKAAHGKVITSYKDTALSVVQGIPSGLGQHDAAYAEFTRRMDMAAEILHPYTQAKAVEDVKKYMQKILRENGFVAPRPVVSEDEKARKDAAQRQAMSRARKAVKAKLPNRKFEEGELEELAKEHIKAKRAEANAANKELKGLAAWCDKVAALSLALPDIATADCREVQLRLAAVIAEVKGWMPEAE